MKPITFRLCLLLRGVTNKIQLAEGERRRYRNDCARDSFGSQLLALNFFLCFSFHFAENAPDDLFFAEGFAVKAESFHVKVADFHFNIANKILRVINAFVFGGLTNQNAAAPFVVVKDAFKIG